MQVDYSKLNIDRRWSFESSDKRYYTEVCRPTPVVSMPFYGVVGLDFLF